MQTSLATEDKMASIIHRLEDLELEERAYVHQVSNPSPMCNHYHMMGHVMEECPSFMGQPTFEPEQVNATFQRPRNELYAPTYNLGWRNHPNFSWSQHHGQGGTNPNFNQGPQKNLNYSRPNLGPQPRFNENDKCLSSLEKGLEAFLKANSQTSTNVANLVQSNSQFV